MSEFHRFVACHGLIAAALCALLGCGAETSQAVLGAQGAAGTGPSFAADDTAPQGDAFCAAMEVMTTACVECHGSERKWGAPMPLTSYEDMMAPAVTAPERKVYELVGERIHDTARPMPELPRVLSEGDKAIIDQWIAAGAMPPSAASCAPPNQTATGNPAEQASTPASEQTAEGSAGQGATTDPVTEEEAPAGEFPWPADCQEFYTFQTYAGSAGSGTPYTVQAGAEEHPQFYFDPPWGNDDVQALDFRPITDNSTVLHHWILYGGSTGSSGIGGEAFLAGWSPGKESRPALPANVGMYMPAGERLRLDVHYYNRGGSSDELDASGVEVCVTRNFREHTATILGLTASATVPAGQKVDNASSCTAQVTGGPAHILAVSPHMHTLGVNAFLSHTPGGGAEQVLHDGPFSFENQQVYDLGDVTVANGDTLTTVCSYQNDTGSTVRFGQNTDDEMCFNFITYYPMGSLRCGGFGF